MYDTLIALILGVLAYVDKKDDTKNFLLGTLEKYIKHLLNKIAVLLCNVFKSW